MPESEARYSKTSWESGEVITKQKMTNISGALTEIDSEIRDARVKGLSNDGTIGKRIDDLIVISDTRPSSSNNEIWIKENGTNIQVPTYDEFNDLILCQDEQPITASNRLWIRENSEADVEVPDMEEFNNLKNETLYIKDNLKNDITDLKNTIKSYIVENTKNLFVDDGFIAYSNLNNTTGEYNINSNNNVNTVANKTLIPVEPGNTYIFSRDGNLLDSTIDVRFFEYNSSEGFLRSYTARTGRKINEDAAFIRIKLSKSNSTEELAALTNYQFEKGSVTSYTKPYICKINDEGITTIKIADEAVNTSKIANGGVTTTKIADEAVTTAKIADEAVTANKTDFFIATRNLYFGKYKPFSNLYLTTGKYYIDSGNTNTVADEEYIEVDPDTDYAFVVFDVNVSYTKQLYEYDQNNEFIKYATVSDVVHTGQTTKYIRTRLFSQGNSEILSQTAKVQFEKGSTPTEYVPAYVLSPEYYERLSSTDEIRLQALSDANLKNNAIRETMVEHLLSNAPRDIPSTVYTELNAGGKAVINRHSTKTADIVKIAFITDIHLGGTRTHDYNPQYNIEAFIAFANANADIAVNAGDLITNYYDATYMDSLQKAKETQNNVHDMFTGLITPYYIAKGNHDIGINGFSVVATPSAYADGYYGIDSETGAIYKITQDNFSAYKTSGEDFYQLTGYTYFTNREIQETCLNNYCQNAIFNELDPYGWYYYVDINNKVRCIVLNEFYNVDDAGGSGGGSRSPYESTWISSVLSNALSTGLAVITISHTTWGMTYSDVLNSLTTFVNNGGVYIGHLHGHEHTDVYKNSSGFNNIGVNASLIRTSNICKYKGFSFDLFEIDLTNNLLYENRIGVFNDKGNDAHGIQKYRSEDRIFDFKKHIQLI